MYITKSKMPDGMVQLKVRASADDVNEAFQIAFEGFASRMSLRVPRGGSIEEVAAEQLKIEDLASVVMDSAVEALVPMALSEAGVNPGFPPEPPKGIILKKGEPYNFQMNVMPRPKYELESYEPVEFTAKPYEADDAAVQKELKEFASYYADYETDSSKAELGEKDSCQLSIEAVIDGKPVTGLNTQGRTYTLGEGLMPKEFDDNIIGMKVGEARKFTFNAPDFDAPTPGAMSEVSCIVELKEIQRQVIPEITDEWVKRNLPDIKTLDALMERITKQVEGPRRAQYQEYLKGLAAKQLIPRFKGSIPDPIYTAMIRNMQSRLRGQAAAEGVSFEEFLQRMGGEEQVNMSIMMQSRQVLVQGYCLDAIFRHERLQVTEDDLMDACRSMDPNNPVAMRKQMERQHCMFVIEEVAERSCAGRWLVEHARITESAAE